MLSLMYLFQIPDPKNLKMAIVSHATCRLACYTAIITGILPRVVSRYMERGIPFSILMPGGKNRVFLSGIFCACSGLCDDMPSPPGCSFLCWH